MHRTYRVYLLYSYVCMGLHYALCFDTVLTQMKRADPVLDAKDLV
jgi:hypothetical protein